MPNISETCMLVGISAPVWGCEREDKQLRKAIADRWGCAQESVRGGKFLIDPNSLKPVSKIAGEARTRNYHLTLPWDDKGGRILNVNGFEQWREEMADFKRRFEQSVMEFCSEYPHLVENARRDLNGLFRQSDYPSAEAIMGKFRFAVRVGKVPEGRDFRTGGLREEEVRAIQEEIEREKDGVVGEAMGEVAERIRGVVRRMMEGLRGYDEQDRKGTRFHDSLVGNVRDLVGVLPNLNLTGDRRITEIADTMRRELGKWDAEGLRGNETARQGVADAAGAVLRRMEGLGL